VEHIWDSLYISLVLQGNLYDYIETSFNNSSTVDFNLSSLDSGNGQNTHSNLHSSYWVVPNNSYIFSNSHSCAGTNFSACMYGAVCRCKDMYQGSGYSFNTPHHCQWCLLTDDGHPAKIFNLNKEHSSNIIDALVDIQHCEAIYSKDMGMIANGNGQFLSEFSLNSSNSYNIDSNTGPTKCLGPCTDTSNYVDLICDMNSSTGYNINQSSEVEHAQNGSIVRDQYGFKALSECAPRIFSGPHRKFDYADNEWLLQAFDIIKQSGVPNHQLAKIQVHSSLNIQLWAEHLEFYHDQLLLQYLQFGFPLSIDTNEFKPLVSDCNHNTALAFEQFVDEYISEEIRQGAIFGPFKALPISSCHVSPMLSRSKDAHSRRIIVDLSYPKGKGLNFYATEHYDGIDFELNYPSVDVIAKRVTDLGPKALLYKIDLRRAFRNLSIDPGDVDKLTLCWRGKYFLDAAIPFGYKHGSACCQRVTDAVRYICNRQGFWLFNYIDDLIGVELPHKAHKAFNFLNDLLKNLGLPISNGKLVSPSPVVTCIGISIDAPAGTLSIDQVKLADIHATCINWLSLSMVTPRQLQSLLGKLLYISKCVPPARIFVGRMLELLRKNRDCKKFQLSTEFFRDLNWFIQFMNTFNGIVFLPFDGVTVELKVDASPYGMGAIFDNLCYAAQLPHGFNSALTIVHLEMLNVVIAFRMWAHLWSNTRVKVICDNAAVVASLRHFRTKDRFLTACCRNIWAIVAKFNIQLMSTHIEGKANILPDILSRWYTSAYFNQAYIQLLTHTFTWCEVPEQFFLLDWSI